MTRLLLPLLLLTLGGCERGEATDVESARSREAIVGGTPTTGDENVYLLMIRGNNGQGSLCTATLIAPRTLLTAAHCADPAILGATAVTILASNVSTQSEVRYGVNTVRVQETRIHPRWAPAIGLTGDLALLLLETPQAVAPKPWNAESLDGLGGAPVRALGYGTIGSSLGSGIKRTVDLTIRQLSADLISLGNSIDKGICHGDSGGPTFHTFADGVERVVGVHSFTRTEACVDGADTRVDAYAPFILQWLADRENECATNGVCAVGACPAPDLDCVAEGGACTGVFQCQGRECVADPQHREPYCARSCHTDPDCRPGFTCDVARGLCQFVQLPEVRPGEPCTPEATFCTQGMVCDGASPGRASCRKPCTMTGQCPNPQRCQAGFSGRLVCTDPPPIVLPAASLEAAAATGCSTGAGLVPLVFLALLHRRR